MKDGKNNKYKELEPYLEGLNFFSRIKSISTNFSKNFKDYNRNQKLPNDIDSIDGFKKFFIKNLYDDRFGEQNKILKQNPIKIFFFYLDELHQIFKENKEEENNQNIKAVEYDKQMAKNLFEDCLKNDKSYITENFFGQKQIIKYCNNCQLTQYLYKYLKVIPIDLKNSTGLINSLEDYLLEYEKKFKENYFCQMCSSQQQFDITLKIVKKPKIIIFIFLNNNENVEVNMNEYIFKKSYKLICAVVNAKPTIRSFLDYMVNSCFSLCKNNNNFKILYDHSEKMFMFDKKQNYNFLSKDLKYKPYVLFYKRIIEEKKVKEDSMEEEFKSQETLIPQFENQNDKKQIVLYFRFEENGKEVYIDTEDNQTFSKIVKMLKKKYQWDDSIFDENKLSYNNKKINPKKTPNELGIKNEEKIMISL